ncbi:MAG: hypothetical protein CMG64_04540 [Candidatus Marinimicrobia bacterium]|nr:hypothetical protein [Candidatus Neomarinimicrobiota bacterium]|tara:strand:+ start:6259 stop:7425 length:1167 start_codon:yes stop_codon:yes gene_type:complete
MKISFITPFFPYRGGISKHSENLYLSFNNNHEIKIINFIRQYPDLLFPGKTQYVTENQDDSNYSNSIRILDTLNPITWYKTAKKINEYNSDILILRYWHPFFIMAYLGVLFFLKRKNKNIKTLAICDNVISHQSFYLENKLVNIFLHKIDKVLVMSNNTENELLNIYSNANYKKLFLPIIDNQPNVLNQNDCLNKLSLNNNKLTLLFFGLIREYKGLDLLIESFSYLEPDILKKIQLLIVGECYENNNKYYNLIKKYNLENNIKWIEEYVPDNMINLYFSCADFVVIPYRSASQSGIIPMAYNYNKPVIVSSAINDNQFSNNKTGIMFNNGNVLELSKVIKNIFNDFINSKGTLNSKSYQNYINNINIIKTKFSTDNFTNQLIEFINE